MKGKEINMLCITMKRGEYFTVDGETVILFEQLSGERAHLTIHAPPGTWRSYEVRCWSAMEIRRPPVWPSCPHEKGELPPGGHLPLERPAGAGRVYHRPR